MFSASQAIAVFMILSQTLFLILMARGSQTRDIKYIIYGIGCSIIPCLFTIIRIITIILHYTTRDSHYSTITNVIIEELSKYLFIVYFINNRTTNSLVLFGAGYAFTEMLIKATSLTLTLLNNGLYEVPLTFFLVYFSLSFTAFGFHVFSCVLYGLAKSRRQFFVVLLANIVIHLANNTFPYYKLFMPLVQYMYPRFGEFQHDIVIAIVVTILFGTLWMALTATVIHGCRRERAPAIG